jgi:hypothetical protein
VWRRRWFVIKDDQLLYCKSATNQRDVTTISLLSAYLAKARPEVVRSAPASQWELAIAGAYHLWW